MAPVNFWEKPLNVVDLIDVGLRSGYVASYYAAPLMVEQRRGLVVFTSASGAVHYVFDPAYGVHKAGMDKMAADMAVNFKDFGITSVSIWMGTLLTERLKAIVASDTAKFGHLIETAETPELTGHVIWALYNDPKLLEMNGQTLIGAELAVKYGIRDEGGRQPPSYRDMHGIAPHAQYSYVIR
jgi:NAD(P)-dependent dehydrogenase (short-subunit alcohol dehydrogenase family)